MNDTGKRLVAAAGEALSRGDLVVDRDVPIVVAAALRELSEALYRIGLPSIEPDELVALADDIEGGGE